MGWGGRRAGLALVRLARGAFQHAVLHQVGQAVGQDIAGDPQFLGKLLEVVQPVESRAQDEERPAFPHHFQRVRQAAAKFAQRFSYAHSESCLLPLSYRQTRQSQKYLRKRVAF